MADDHFPDNVTLSHSQHEVLQTILQGKSVFYTGAAGTGKSFILRILQEILLHMSDKESIAFTSPTGVAACNIGGMTIHSWAGVGLGAESAEVLSTRVSRNKVSKQRWNSAKILVIDEISMLSAELFDKLNIIGQRVRDCSELFGGIQLILCGDFFQLPPVATGGSKAKYSFESSAWQFLFPIGCSSNTPAGAADDSELRHNKMIVLNKIFRQKDSKFINILNEMRCGRMSAASIEFLRRKCISDAGRELMVETNSKPEAPFSVNTSADSAAVGDGTSTAACAVTATKITPTKLFSVNRDVNEVNSRQLEELPTDRERYTARDHGDEWNLKTLRNGLKVPEMLELRVGAQVMLLKNLDVSRGLANGTRGKVIEFVETGDRSSIFPGQLLPKVEFYCTVGDKQTTVVEVLAEEEWSIQVGESVKASRKQIPLMLAWAISIHKAQGMTIPFLEVSLQNVFEYGQAYVSISRAVNLEGLILRHFDASRVKAHATVVAFYKNMGFDFQTEDEGGVDGPAGKGTVDIETQKLIDMFKEAFEGNSHKKSSVNRKRKTDDGFIDPRSTNKNIPPWMVQKEKEKRRGESMRANSFFLPQAAITAARKKKEAEAAAAASASAPAAPVAAEIQQQGSSSAEAPRPPWGGKMDAYFRKPAAIQASEPTISPAVGRYNSRFVSAAGRNIGKNASHSQNNFEQFKCTDSKPVRTASGTTEYIILSDDSNSNKASSVPVAGNSVGGCDANTENPSGAGIWDFFADSTTAFDSSPAHDRGVQAPPAERPFQASKSSFDYCLETRDASQGASAPSQSMRSIIASTQVSASASGVERMPPGVVSVPPGVVSVPPGVVKVPVGAGTVPWAAAKPNRVIDPETAARIEGNRLAAVKRLQETRRRAQEDAGAVFSQIVSVESGGTKEFQYF